MDGGGGGVRSIHKLTSCNDSFITHSLMHKFFYKLNESFV